MAETAPNTSQSHPLRIDSVKVPNGGLIGMTICPGKKQGQSWSGSWFRDLATDLDAIQEWGATTIVTLMELDELVAVGADKIGEAAEARGLDWYFLPISDVSTPDTQFEITWAYAGHRLRDTLRRGCRVLIHCRAGLGRTGMIAGRLLVELGMEGTVAIDAVRKARSGTIQTSEQEDHVRRSTSQHDQSHGERALASLLGGGTGDGFGYTVEFTKFEKILERFGTNGLTEPKYQNGKLIVTDDTQMTLFTLEGLNRARGADEKLGPDRAVSEIRAAYMDWYRTQGGKPNEGPAGTLWQASALNQSRAPGSTCLGALRQGGQGTTSRPLNDSMGCGGVMRIAPIGWMECWSPAQCYDVAVQAAALTHGHRNGWAPAGALAMMIRMLIDGASILEAAERTINFLREPDTHETRSILETAIELTGRPGTTVALLNQRLGEGWVGHEALAIALYSSLKGDNFKEALCIAANHDGDSDSTASIAGQLWGAANGLDALPNEWVRRLDVWDEVMHLFSTGWSGANLSPVLAD
jgi:ADP-ribosyl-[dinitrogen reductase] hydrolase